MPVKVTEQTEKSLNILFEKSCDRLHGEDTYWQHFVIESSAQRHRYCCKADYLPT
jgi:hypothetical protein